MSDSVVKTLTGIANEIAESDDFKRLIVELGPDQIRANIAASFERMAKRRADRERMMNPEGEA